MQGKRRRHFLMLSKTVNFWNLLRWLQTEVLLICAYIYISDITFPSGHTESMPAVENKVRKLLVLFSCCAFVWMDCLQTVLVNMRSVFYQTPGEDVPTVNLPVGEKLDETKMTPSSFAPEGFVFQPPSGLKTFEPAPLSPRSADAFLSPRYFFSLCQGHTSLIWTYI